MSDNMDDHDFMPATMANDEIYIGTRKYVAADRGLDYQSTVRALLQHHESEMLAKGRNPLDYTSKWSLAASVLSETPFLTSDEWEKTQFRSQAASTESSAMHLGEVLAEHSGCGFAAQIEQVTVRLERGDRVVLLRSASIQGASK